MSLKFDKALNIVAEQILEAPKPKYQTYSQDAAEISAKLDQELISINSIFKGTVSNWDEITVFEAEVPKYSRTFLRLKIPFAVEPQRVFGLTSVDGEIVNLKTSVIHPAVENGYLNGEKLIQLFIWDLNRVLDRIPKLTCSSGKMYTLRISAHKVSDGTLHVNIVALKNDSEDFPSIVYNFVPSFTFTNKSSFFYIHDSKFFHQMEDIDLIALIKKEVKMKQNVKILIQTLENQSSKILTSVILSKLLESENGIGSLLLKAIQFCISHLQYPGPLINAYGKLLQFKQSDSVQLSELKEVFGLK